MIEATFVRPRVLVVEDDPEQSEQMERTLSDLGYDVVDRARSGLSGVRAARRHHPDLVLMDVRLPGALDGPGAARAISETEDIPMVFVTGANDGEEFRRLIRSTPHGCVVKPFGRGQLEAAVELGLQQGRSERARKEREKWLERMAHEDPLTGLMNRRAFHEHAARYLALAKRKRTSLGVIYLDLVGFKAVNDGFGHEAGDEVLAVVARRLEAGARESDLVCRMGGDEFVVLVPDVDGRSAAMEVAHRMDHELREPITAAGSRVEVRADMGVAIYPDDGSSVDALLRSADRSLYGAKDDRKG